MNSKGLKALYKIDHTICMNWNERRIKFGIDNCDCQSLNDFLDCYDTIRKELLFNQRYIEELTDTIRTLKGGMKNEKKRKNGRL